MSFKKNLEEWETVKELIFYDAEVLSVLWETKPEIVERLLPPPLKPVSKPIVSAFVANYPKTNFGVSYLESAISLNAEFDGEEGNYYLAMHVTNDMALVGGREKYGYPKKMGNIYISREKRNAEGWAERYGTRLLDIKTKLNNRLNAADAMEIFEGNMGPELLMIGYNYKHFPSPTGDGYDYNPRLIRTEVGIKPNQFKLGQAEIKLGATESDPWSEIEIVRVLGAYFLKGNVYLRQGSVVAEVGREEFEPYSFIKWDIDFLSKISAILV
ncbi:MAG: acetoacetate decarboxylase family protein [Promethearchaeota archaeon]